MREKREERQLSVRGLARLCGLTASYLSKVERGLEKPSLHLAGLLSRHLNLDSDEAIARAGHVPADVQALLAQDSSLCAEVRRLARERGCGVVAPRV